MKRNSIAIDGPSGAGKSTLSKQLAERLGYLYVDTGAIYRTVGLFAYRHAIDPQNEAVLEGRLNEVHIDLTYGEDGLQHMLLNGEDVTTAIREHIISDYASRVSALPVVRAFLLQMQRSLAQRYDVVMDGRDIGTVVLPDADLKIYLTADAQARAVRRCRELQERGQRADYETVLKDVVERDERDINREIAPLRRSDDAVLVDTTELTLEQSLQRLLALAEERFHE